MDFEQDYLMRMIKQLVKALIRVLLGKKNNDSLEIQQELVQSSDLFYQQLLNMVNQGKINEAENLLYDHIDYNNNQNVCNAVSFYGYLNEFDDDFLEKNNYTRAEIEHGVKAIAQHMEMNGVVNAFLQ